MAETPGQVEGSGLVDFPHHWCVEVLRADMAPAEVTVSTAPPIVAGPFTAPEGFLCPHGTRFWVEPTGEQLSRWQAEEAR